MPQLYDRQNNYTSSSSYLPRRLEASAPADQLGIGKRAMSGTGNRIVSGTHAIPPNNQMGQNNPHLQNGERNVQTMGQYRAKTDHDG